MALTNLMTAITLDVYDHASTQTSIKSISCDSNTRFVRAALTYAHVPYKVSVNAEVTLTVVRPDGAAVNIEGEAYNSGSANTDRIVAELTDVATAVKGTILAQFKIEDGEQVLRTEVFKIDNGVALDIDTDKWADTYQGYDLSEFVTKDENRTYTAKVDALDQQYANMIKQVPTLNLFNKDDVITGSIVNPYTGELIEYAGTFHAFIEFTQGTYTFVVPYGLFGTGNAFTLPVFNADRSIIAYVEATSHSNIDSMFATVVFDLSAQMAANGKYFGVNGTVDELDTLMVVKSSVYPSTYSPYGTYKTIEGLQIKKDQIIDLDSIDAGNPLSGKILACTGDSICAGAGYAGGYAKIIGEENGMTVQNIAVGGGTLAHTGSTFCISESIGDLRADADYVILDGGGNDADSGVSLGTISQGYNAELDNTTFIGAFETMLKAAITRFPTKKIGYIFIHKCVYLFDSSVENSYYDAAKKCCEKWGIPYCDLNTQTLPLNYIEALRTAYTANGDGYHPNEQGYKLFYVPKITAWLKTL